ncbi:sensory neuron membrane protein 2-like isoform X1 [Ischnura elegans]|uniref:sensory neuron membrane protein 2-like isoform X1 n=1 Tax=Ischnura elegans TaxID=197161 RepID=UPI001ED8733F|nr:sensory neuron membrane protein 2-like isoform X1 [Ischnura elegans]
MGCCSKIVVAVVLVVLGAVFLIVGCVLGFAVFPNIIQQMVAENVILKEGTQAWDVWKKLPIPMNFEVYFFNVTNVDEVQMGMKPKLKEVGPYVYKEYKEKHDIVIDEISGTASYYQNTLFEFDAEASGDLTESDNVTIYNLAIMGLIETVKIMFPSFTFIDWDKKLPDVKNVFLTDSVKNILFDGALFLNCTTSPACGLLNLPQHLPPTIIKDPDENIQFALFRYKNNTYDGRYEVKLGWSVDGPNPTVDGVKLIGKIVRWENSTTLTKWSGDCNKLTGTDATIFPPFLTADSKIDIFSTDLCRSLTALYDKDSSYQGIDSLRFTAHEMLLADVKTNPDNYCFCPDKRGCLLKGALDLYACQGAPAILTFPHFYLAGERYLEMVEGLNPNKELHETFLEIEPNTGVPLRGGKKVQFNLQMKKYDKFSVSNNLTNALFPIAWINEGVSLDDANVNKLKDQLVNNLKIVTGVTWGLIGIGIAMIFAGICLFLLAKCRSGMRSLKL